VLAARLARRILDRALVRAASGRSTRAAAAHSAATATPSVLRDALLAQAGVLAVDGLSELSAVTALLCAQPLPAGPRVAVVGNAGGVGVLAADACDRQGLWVRALRPRTRAALAALLPAGTPVANPVDTTATISSTTFGEVVALLRADPEVDAVLAIAAPTALGDPLDGVAAPQESPPNAARTGPPSARALTAVRRLSPWRASTRPRLVTLRGTTVAAERKGHPEPARRCRSTPIRRWPPARWPPRWRAADWLGAPTV
jgi:acyl-CoA synthetase (NDP forming)